MDKNPIIDKLKSFLSGKATTKRTTNKSVKTQEPYVYLTTKGKKFHWDPMCSGLVNAKNPVKMSLSNAKKAGYKACDKCCYDYLKD